MERYILDTNIVVFWEADNLSKETEGILGDLNNQLNISSVAVVELFQLYRIGKVKTKKYKTANEIVQAIEKDFYINIIPFAKEHTVTLSLLETAKGHNDPFDHSIISHAITEKLTLISSDRQFENYAKQKLKFVFNKR
jgi:tRNA(fMet)-specific endonuclease VapC